MNGDFTRIGMNIFYSVFAEAKFSQACIRLCFKIICLCLVNCKIYSKRSFSLRTRVKKWVNMCILVVSSPHPQPVR